jgi:hypothetical protein
MPDELDTALAEPQHSLSNVRTLNNICISMKDNTSKLLTALKGILEETRSVIDRTLRLLPVVALGVGLLTTSCRIYGREATIQPNRRSPP